MKIDQKTERDQRFVDNLLNDVRAAAIVLARHGLLDEVAVERQKIFDAEEREVAHVSRRESKRHNNSPHIDLSNESCGIQNWDVQRRD